MKKNKRFTVHVKRKRTKKTNYAKRLGYVKSQKTRLVIRPHTNNITIQFVKYEPKSDKILVTTHSQELRKINWHYHLGNIPSSYLTGLLCGVKAKQKNVHEAILDTGLHKSSKGSRIYAALKGVIDAGIHVPHSEEILPDKEAIEGKKIENYAKILSQSQDSYKRQFSSYLKKSVKAEEISQRFSEVKSKILK
ncbi:50S ribosomal protein L18 [Candidatus Woesearchaeota archaeon]|nr:50S ribosomal protein L18 [Candidatus Woesearchaeota archaeon]